MNSMVLFDTVDSEQSQVRFQSNYPDVKLYYASTVSDLFDLLDRKPNLIVMEAVIPKEDKGIIIGSKRIKSPFSIIKYLRKKNFKFVIYTKGTKNKSFRELKKSYERIRIEIVNKDIEKNDFKRIFDRYFLDFSKAKIKEF